MFIFFTLKTYLLWEERREGDWQEQRHGRVQTTSPSRHPLWSWQYFPSPSEERQWYLTGRSYRKRCLCSLQPLDNLQTQQRKWNNTQHSTWLEQQTQHQIKIQWSQKTSLLENDSAFTISWTRQTQHGVSDHESKDTSLDFFARKRTVPEHCHKHLLISKAMWNECINTDHTPA